MNAARPVLSVLDLVPVSAGRTRADALREMLELARTADEGTTAQPGDLGPVPALIAASVCTLAVVQALTGEVALAAGPARWLLRVLDTRPLRWVGSRSYGLYLWHWPLGVLAFYTIPPTINPWVTALGVLGLTLWFTEMSYTYIETPVRRHGLVGWLRRSVRLRPRQLVPLGGGLTALALLISLGFSSQPNQTAAQQAIAAGGEYLTVSATAPPASADPSAESAEPTAGETASPYTGADVTVVGDSVTVAAAPSLEWALPGVAVDAEVSRSVYAAQSVLETADAAGARPCVVVSLATNGPVDTGQLDSILSYLGPRRSLVLVTGYGPARTTWIPEADETIRDFAAAHPDQVAVADWEAAIAAHPDLLYDDQIHPLPEGGDLYAQTVADAIASLKRQPS